MSRHHELGQFITGSEGLHTTVKTSEPSVGRDRQLNTFHKPTKYCEVEYNQWSNGNHVMRIRAFVDHFSEGPT